MAVEQAYQYLYIAVLAVIGVLIGIILIRSIIGPRITDRILCINMISTLVICAIAILSQMLHEGYLTDIALIYAMFSFLSVMVLATVYIRKHPESEPEEPGDPDTENEITIGKDESPSQPGRPDNEGIISAGKAKCTADSEYAAEPAVPAYSGKTPRAAGEDGNG